MELGKLGNYRQKYSVYFILLKRNSLQFRKSNKATLDKILITYVGIEESSHSIINDKPFNLLSSRLEKKFLWTERDTDMIFCSGYFTVYIIVTTNRLKIPSKV